MPTVGDRWAEAVRYCIRLKFPVVKMTTSGLSSYSLVMKAIELYPFVKGRELQVVVGFGGEQRVSTFVDETVVITQCAT